MEQTTQNSLFETILNEHKGIFFKIAKTYCKNEDDRKDLLQEMMIQVWQSLPRYKSDFKLSTWLYRVVLNVAISYYRKQVIRQNHHQIIDFSIQDFVDTPISESNPNLELLETFISELNDLDKALIVLYLEDKNHGEISEILGISVSNVSTKVLRIKEKLKQKFSKQQ
ncbi:DNA-directed RNA polymerase sigma-70 factor [Emticicia aquatilis]|uniref:DNA-directed RNA polymerase sigma-70 factor n=1 Tax=Emticicia aquatilis TaxID=1537369 RepID=A0A916YDD4_9BACT|nr:RNA polymerase sigma factor [Emticicia aquatilis]GGD41007.1 DNA-directed RNA polymerase sigma-70 factor [Emticicia aquatilis]